MTSASRSTGLTPDPLIDGPAADDAELAPGVTRREATIAAQHAIHVQGGLSTPENEAVRIAADRARGGNPDLEQMAREVNEALAAKVAALIEEHAVADNDLGNADPSLLDFAKLRRYRELREAQGISEAEVKAFKEEATKLEAELVDMFTDAGMQNINLDGKTIYLHRSVYAQRLPGKTLEDVKAALIAAGAGDLVTETVNANTLSAWVRELTEDDDAPGLPDEVAAVLEPGERFGVRINAAGSKPKSKTRSK